MKEFIAPCPTDLTYLALLTAISEVKLQPPTDPKAVQLYHLKLRELVAHGYIKGRVGCGASGIHLTPEGREELLRRLNRQTQTEKAPMPDKKTPPNSRFRPGDAVQLRSGGPRMTVNYIWYNGLFLDVECVWQVEGIMQRRRINQDALKGG
jgi:uncharacterized protein YodC (DUF2158 family)